VGFNGCLRKRVAGGKGVGEGTSLGEELDVTSVEKIVTTGYEDFY
jgi:hypothetical protein